MEVHFLPFMHSQRPREVIQSQLFKKDGKAYPSPTLPWGSGKGTKSEGKLHDSPRASGSWLGKTLTSELWTFIRRRSLTWNKQGYQGQARKWLFLWLFCWLKGALGSKDSSLRVLQLGLFLSLVQSLAVLTLKKLHDPSPDSCPKRAIPTLKKLRKQTPELTWEDEREKVEKGKWGTQEGNGRGNIAFFLSCTDLDLCISESKGGLDGEEKSLSKQGQTAVGCRRELWTNLMYMYGKL